MWIQYGMTKQYGGLDKLLKRFEKFTDVVQSDASGYDRSAYLLYVFYLRWKHLVCPSELDDMLFWTMYHSIFPFVVAPNGDVYQRACGNNSGQDGTASNNSLLHDIIIKYLLCYAYHKKTGEMLSLDDMNANAYVGIYSDDKIGGINFSFFWDDDEDFGKDEVFVYGKFNMVIKPSSILVTKNIPGQPIDSRHEFLGSLASYSKEREMYYGYPRIGKICSSITRAGMVVLEEPDYFRKLCALASLSVGEPWLKEKIFEYMNFIIARSKTPELLRNIRKENEVLGDRDLLRIHFGREGKTKVPQPKLAGRECYRKLLTSRNLEKVDISEKLNVSVNFFFGTLYSFSEGRTDLKDFMANARVKRAEDMLSALATNGNCELTQEGKAFVIQRFDPYHDTPIKPTGYPDQYNGFTISRCVKKSITVQQTSGGGPSNDTFSFHVYNTPMLEVVTLAQCTNQKGNSVSLPDSPVITQGYGGLTIQLTDVDGNCVYPTPNLADILGQLVLDPQNDLDGTMRVTAMGFEVIDVTAEIYQQGTITVYRQNQPASKPEVLSVDNTVAGSGILREGVISVLGYKFPPANTAEALNIPTTRQWQAREGAYFVADFNTDELPMDLPTFTQPAYSDYVDDEKVNNVDSYDWIPLWDATITKNIVASPSFSRAQLGWGRTKHMPINQSGCFVTGAPKQGSYTINAIWYLECAPNGGDPKLLTLATPSPVMDNLCKKYLSQLRHDSPIAVKWQDNYLGEWFVDGVTDVIKKVTPWLANAQVIGNQVVKWGDTEKANNGMISPQSFVQGDVAKKVSNEKKLIAKITNGIPLAPGPAPKKAAYRPAKPIGRMRGYPEPERKAPLKRVRTRQGDMPLRHVRGEEIRYQGGYRKKVRPQHLRP